MWKVLARFAAAGLAGSVMAAATTTSVGAQERARATASAVKAAYLLNFTRYVDWPASAFQNNRSPFVICVIGTDPFGSALDEVMRNRRVQGRAIDVRRLPAPAPSSTCHIAFLAKGEPALKHAQRAWPTNPVLLVGEGASFAAKGGTIAFVAADETVRFQINAKAASERGVRISSRVMALATHVYGTGDNR